MKRMLVFGIPIIVLLSFFLIRKVDLIKKSAKQTFTEVIKYEQNYIPEKKKEGSCWTTSIAAQSNEKAWRCSVENGLYDPCFETQTKQIVCLVDPDDPYSGFELKLTEALPEFGTGNQQDVVWITKLENGLTCSLSSGAADELNGEFFYYYCNNSAVLLGNWGKTFDKSQSLWKVRVAYLDENFDQKGLTETVNVLKAWK